MKSAIQAMMPIFNNIFLTPARPRWHRLFAVTTVLPLLWLWDVSGLDLPLARWFGGPDGFPLQYHPLLVTWLHDGVRRAGWALLACLTLSVWWPVGPLKQLRKSERAWMMAAVCLSLLLVVSIKGISRTSCPWDLAEFGGTASHVSHWALGVSDGGGGRCFPAGHASTAFAFLALAVWLQPIAHRASKVAWITVLIAGLALGWVQQARGAHYLSHTLWTAWLCWAVAVSLHSLTQPSTTHTSCTTPN